MNTVKRLQVRLLFVGMSLGLAVWCGRAVAADPELQARDGAGSHRPKLGFTLLGGLAIPWCGGQPDCGGDIGNGPSIAGLALFVPNDSWEVGLEVQMSRVHWRESDFRMDGGGTVQIDSDLTAGFAALAARHTFLPGYRLTPVVQVAVGAGLQSQTGTNLHTNDGFIPTGQVAFGARARASTNLSFFALASATFGIKEPGRSAIDAAGPTPFAGWGVGLQVGAAFDVPL
jgi:hypothetical protein